MITLKQALQSTVGRKLITGLTGLGLVAFVATHLLENMLLFRSDPNAYNAYVAWLHSFGGLLTLAELGLAALFLVHILNSLWIKKTNLVARPIGYRMARSKGGPTRSNLASRNMAITGTILLAFLILHILQFRFGPGVAQGYVTTVKGEDAVDLRRLVVEVFHNPVYAAIYVGAMLFLGFHVRHGFWSMFQTLGAMSPRFTKPIHFLGLVVGILLACGFLLIPIWIYFDIPTLLFSAS